MGARWLSRWATSTVTSLQDGIGTRRPPRSCWNTSECDHCLFYMTKNTDMLIVLLHVNDIITAHTRGTSVRSAWADNFTSKFRWTDFGARRRTSGLGTLVGL
eukprot:6182206-Pleurochrysis_carterae.AAC.1